MNIYVSQWLQTICHPLTRDQHQDSHGQEKRANRAKQVANSLFGELLITLKSKFKNCIACRRQSPVGQTGKCVLYK